MSALARARLLAWLALLAAGLDWARPLHLPLQHGLVLELLIYAALFVLQDLLRPKPKLENAKPAGLGDFQFPTATEGRPVPLLWGRAMMAGPNVVWYGDLFADAISKRIKTGLFTSKRQVIGYRYKVGMQLALCRGPVDGIRRLWVGENLVYDGGLATTNIDIDLPDLYGGDQANGGLQASVNIHLGTTTQAVNQYLGRFQDSGAGTNRTPRYTGTAYVVARELGSTNPAVGTGRGAYLGNSPNGIQPWKFEVERYPALFSGQTSGQNKIGGVDCNPINVIYEILTNQEWGFGQPAGDVDVGNPSSFKTASDTIIAEGNGFSMVLDRTMEAAELLRIVEQQVDGIVFLDHRSGKWKIKLARGDYDVNTVPQLSPANVKEVRDFTRGSWEDTSNYVTVKFSHRDNDYKESYALAQDMANAMIQGGGTSATVQTVVAAESYPGIMDPDVANDVAWRDLRAMSFPLARCTFVVDRTFYALTVGDVVAWTDDQFGFVKLPMRLTRVDYGRLQQNEIELTAVQDVFVFMSGAFGSPPISGWVPPGFTLADFDDQLAFEAPRGLLLRDPDYSGHDAVPKILCAARRKDGEAAFLIEQRNDAGAPSGAFAAAGEVAGFMLVGKLNANLPTASANPTTTVTIKSDPDSQTALRTQFPASAAEDPLVDLGTYLTTLIYCDGEFMLPRWAQNGSGSTVDLKEVYRGVMDTPQRSHAADSKVYLVFVGAGLSDSIFPATNNVEVRLRAEDLVGGVFGGTPTTISFTGAYRSVRPYSPGVVRYNGSGTHFGTPSLEGAGSGINGFRVDVDWFRRDFQTGDEVAALLADVTPTMSGHETQLEVRADPLGANTLVGTLSAWTAGAGPLSFTRVDVITAAAAGTLLRVILRSRHDYVFVDHENRDPLFHDFVPTTAYSGKFYFGGGLAANVSSATYTAAATGTFTLRIGATQATANIQVNVAGGGFVTVIAPGNLTGTFSATSGDSIVIRRTVSEAPNPNGVQLENPSAVVVSYGSFKN